MKQKGGKNGTESDRIQTESERNVQPQAAVKQILREAPMMRPSRDNWRHAPCRKSRKGRAATHLVVACHICWRIKINLMLADCTFSDQKRPLGC